MVQFISAQRQQTQVSLDLLVQMGYEYRGAQDWGLLTFLDAKIKLQRLSRLVADRERDVLELTRRICNLQYGLPSVAMFFIVQRFRVSTPACMGGSGLRVRVRRCRCSSVSTVRIG